MQIVVNHLTRMQPGYVCVAGIDVSNNQHIRPVLSGRLTTDLLALNGGPFDIASLVDLGPVKYCGRAPEVEDYSFNPPDVQIVEILSHERFWKLLQNVARRSIVEIFGPSIKSFKRSCVVDVGKGEASLGCLIPAAPPTLYVKSYDGRMQIRAVITDGNFDVDLSVTDIRLWEIDHKTPKEILIRGFDRRMKDGTPIILSIGLGRPFIATGDTVGRHWLQVNNIHFCPE